MEGSCAALLIMYPSVVGQYSAAHPSPLGITSPWSTAGSASPWSTAGPVSNSLQVRNGSALVRGGRICRTACAGAGPGRRGAEWGMLLPHSAPRPRIPIPTPHPDSLQVLVLDPEKGGGGGEGGVASPRGPEQRRLMLPPARPHNHPVLCVFITPPPPTHQPTHPLAPVLHLSPHPAHGFPPPPWPLAPVSYVIPHSQSIPLATRIQDDIEYELVPASETSCYTWAHRSCSPLIWL